MARGRLGLRKGSAKAEVGAIHIEAANLNGDDRLDVLISNATTGTVAWYENLNAQTAFGPTRK